MMVADIFRMKCTAEGNLYITARLNVKKCPSLHATAKLFWSPLQPRPPRPPLSWGGVPGLLSFTGICFVIYIIEFLAKL